MKRPVLLLAPRRCSRPLPGSRPVGLLLVAALLAGPASPAAAKKRKAPAAAPAAAAAGPSAEVKEKAKAHYAAGEKLFAAQQYEQAMAEYVAAHDTWPLEGFLFNIAQCHRNLGRYAQAIDYFERYLQSPKADRNRAEVQVVVADLRRKLDAGAQPADASARLAEEQARRAADAKAQREQADLDARAAEAKEREAEAEAARARLIATTAEPGGDTRPLYKRPYFWVATGIAVVVVGVGVGAIVGGTRANELPPGGTLGIVDWR